MPGLSTTPRKHTLKDRGNDLYETPPVATQALLKVERLPLRIWEPAAGHGAIVKVLRDHGHNVVATDLADYDEDTHFPYVDFLMWSRRPGAASKCRCIVTNPPYKLADEFVRHGLKLCPKVIMLLRLAFLEGNRRSDLIDKHLARVHVFRNRLPMMHRAGWKGPRTTSSVAFAWFVFKRNHTGPIKLDRITWKV